MTYKILPYTKEKAKKLGVKVEPSDKPNSKIKVTEKDGNTLYIGAAGYKDYPTYTKEKGVEYANKRRALYKIRHEKDRLVKGSKGYYADNLLW